MSQLNKKKLIRVAWGYQTFKEMAPTEDAASKRPCGAQVGMQEAAAGSA